MKIKFSRIAIIAAILILSGSVPALAQEDKPSPIGLMPSISSEEVIDAEVGFEIDATHPPIRVTPDKAEMVRLERDATTVIVGNPVHASVMVENKNLLVIVPKRPGATYFTVMDSNKQIIMQRHIIVAAPKEKYIRLHRNCNTPAMSGEAQYDLGECYWMSVYYCPEGEQCHEIYFHEEEGGEGGDTGDEGDGNSEADD